MSYRLIVPVVAPVGWRARYNSTPAQHLPVIRLDAGRREMVSLRWGLIPSWAKDERIGWIRINRNLGRVFSNDELERLDLPQIPHRGAG